MSSLAIVALPSKDDYVFKISSEKVPHMTLLFLGEDVTKVKNLDKILDFVGHAANTSLKRFGLEVDHRGTLGPEEADVLFFSTSKWSGFETVKNYRSYLLKESNIRTAYDSATQFPEFTPHLTLGYPATPAKPDNRDYPGISYVQFDRIAVWYGDYEGIEFPLKTYDWDMDMAMSDLTEKSIQDILEHHGVRGMKWGVRRKATVGPQEVVVRDSRKKIKTSGGVGHPAHPDAVRAHKIQQVRKKSGTKALSNKDLEDYTKRLNLETNAKRLHYANSNQAKRFVLSLMGQTGKTQASTLANDIASTQVKRHIGRHLIKAGVLSAA